LEFGISLLRPAPEFFGKEQIHTHLYIATCSFPSEEIGYDIRPKVGTAIQGNNYVKNVLRSCAVSRNLLQQRSKLFGNDVFLCRDLQRIRACEFDLFGRTDGFIQADLHRNSGHRRLSFSDSLLISEIVRKRITNGHIECDETSPLSGGLLFQSLETIEGTGSRRYPPQAGFKISPDSFYR
jgi:hypothetical protein